MVIVLGWLVMACPSPGVEVFLRGDLPPNDVLPAGLNPGNHFLDVVRNEDPDLPGRGQPSADLPLQVLEITWDPEDRKTSHLVVLGGDPRERQAMVFTWQQPTHDDVSPVIRVFYGGRAFLDEHGRIQFDCRLQPVSGENSSGWSPDSFAVDPRLGTLKVMDDRGSSSTGTVKRTYRPGIPAKGDDLDYWAIRRVIQCYLTGLL